ncbi:MAG: hypothetical protein Q7W30_05880 [Coriobacteriia bacterium]|nr:hypothetical protein [Coriobacteriia bacterium]
MARRRYAAWAVALVTAFLIGSASTAYAVEQTYEGDLVKIIMSDTARPAILVKSSEAATSGAPYVRQYYSDDDWGSMVWLASADTSESFDSGYLTEENSAVGPAALTTFIPVSNTKTAIAGGTKITTVVDLGTTGVRMTQVFTHMTGDRFVTKQWTLTNSGATTFTGARFYHGGDAYFGGEDDAYGFYDPSKGMVYLRNNDYTNWGLMGFYADPTTPSSRYFEGVYSDGNNLALAGDNLTDSVESSFEDAGYYLQWDRTGLAPGQSWTIKANEIWTPAGALQILAPAPKTVTRGSTVPLQFTLQNLTENTMTLTLSASAGGWGTSLVGDTAQVISPNSSVVRTVNVSVPGNAMGVKTVTLSGTDGDAISASASTRLTAPTSVARFLVGTPHLKWIIRRGRAFEVYGALSPAHKAHTKWVVLRFERWTGKRWVFAKSVGTYSYSLANGNPSNHYGIWTRLWTRGKYRVKAYHPADADGPATWTGYNWFWIR